MSSLKKNETNCIGKGKHSVGYMYQGIAFRSYQERGATSLHFLKGIRASKACLVAIIWGTHIRYLSGCYFYPLSRGNIIQMLFLFMQTPNKGHPVSENKWRVIFVFSYIMTFFFFLNAAGKWWGRTCVTIKIALFKNMVRPNHWKRDQNCENSCFGSLKIFMDS